MILLFLIFWIVILDLHKVDETNVALKDSVDKDICFLLQQKR